MNCRRITALFSSLCLLFSGLICAAEVPEREMRTVSVAAFKNGLSFVLQQGTVRIVAGEGRIAASPNATLGTLWLTPNDPGATLDELVAHRYKAAEQQNFSAIAEILLANKGRVVTVVSNQKEYTGEFLGLREPERTTPEDLAGETRGLAVKALPSPQILLAGADGKLISLRLSEVERLYLPDHSVLPVKQEDRVGLRFKIKGVGERANVTMGYLEKGLGWAPSYLVSLKDDQSATITMQSVVINDVEDLKDADDFFVVGVPNFVYADIPSPMSLQQAFGDLRRMERDSVNGRRDLYANAVMGQLAGYAANEPAASPAAGFSVGGGELVGAPEEDLFLYTRSGVTLARGERAAYHVFSGTVAYEHIYEWEVPNTSRVDSYGNVQSGSSSPSDKSAMNSVWHSLRLKNTSKFPWTSAPAMVLSGTKPIAQDTLPYTPRGANTNLKLTIATDLRAGQEEREVSRQENVPRRQGYHYDLVTVEGTLKIKNFKTKDVRLAVHRAFRGTFESSTDDGKAEKMAEAIQADNPATRLTWEIPLKPGEEKIVTYRYKIWVRL